MSLSKTQEFIDIISTKQVLEDYLEIRQRPAFRAIVGAIAEMRLNGLGATPSAERALQGEGFRACASGALHLLDHADDYAVDIEEDKTDKTMIRYLVEVEGYSLPEAKEMISNSAEL